MAHLNAGQPLPDPVVPPTGSSAELYQWVTSRPKAQPSLFACYQQNTRDFEKTKHCIFEALRDNLTAVRPDPELSQNEALLQRRLGMARRCAPRAARTAGAHYVLVPAAAGAREGNMTMYGGIEQMMLGGIKPTPSGVFTSRHEHALRTRVRRVDAVQWLLDSVREEDYVVLKLDVEGEEHHIMRDLMLANATRLVDLLLWECHSHVYGTSCWRLNEQLLASGMSVHHEPNSIACQRKGVHHASSPWECTDWDNPKRLRSPKDCATLGSPEARQSAFCRQAPQA